jgi:hypothetical protein
MKAAGISGRKPERVCRFGAETDRMTHAEYRAHLQKLVRTAVRVYDEIGRARHADVLRDLPADDMIEQMEIILEDAGNTALSLRGQLEEAVNELPTDWPEQTPS